MAEPQKPKVGKDVSHLMPAVGADVSSLMGRPAPSHTTVNVDDEIKSAQQTIDAKKASRTWFDSASDFVKGVGTMVDPRPVLSAMFTGPQTPEEADILTISGQQGLAVRRLGQGVLVAQGDQFKKAAAAYKAGRYSEAVGHLTAGAVPLVGPGAAQAGETIGRGEVAKGLGEATALLASPALKYSREAMVTGRVMPTAAAVKAARAQPRIPAPTPKASDAVAFADRNQIPVDAATRTDSRFLRNVEKRVANTMGGASTAENFEAAQAAGLERAGNRLAGQVSPQQASTTTAGRAVSEALADKVTAASKEADQAYAQLRTIASKNTATRSVAPGQPFQSMEMPVDLRAARATLQPLYDQLMRERELVPLQGAKGRALVALDRLMQGDNFAPLEIVDKARGELLAMVRSGKGQFMSEGQAAASTAAQALDTQIRDVALKMGGKNAVAALEKGRAATTRKYVIADVADMLSGDEPGRVFTELTARKDVAVERLRAVQRHAPDQIPKVGRAFLEQLLDKAVGEGGFKHADALWSAWQNLGPETKAILFGGKTTDINNFFLLAKKIAQNPNPSGTAYSMHALNVTSAPLTYMLAKVLYTSGGGKVLSAAMKIPPANKVALAAMVAQLSRIAGEGAMRAAGGGEEIQAKANRE